MLAATVAPCPSPFENHTYTLAESFERQVFGCASTGSPLYASLLNGLLADYLAGGFTAEILEGVSEQAAARRGAAALPRDRASARAERTRTRRSPRSIRRVAGTWDGRDVTDVVPLDGRQQPRRVRPRRTARCADQRGRPRGRAGLRASPCSPAATRASRSTCSRSARRRAAVALGRVLLRHRRDDDRRPADSPLSLRTRVVEGTEALARRRHPRRRASGAVDINPIDVSTEEGRTTMLSFLWPDQMPRIERLRCRARGRRGEPADRRPRRRRRVARTSSSATGRLRAR